MELEAADQSQRAELARLHESARADGSKISVLEKQLSSTDRRMRELDKQLRSREEEVQHTRGLSQGVKAREQHLQERQRQLLADNNRLLKLLARTVEYKSVAQDAQQSEGFSHIAHNTAASYRAQTEDATARGGAPNSGEPSGAARAAMELQSWVPSGVLEAALELRHRLDESVPADELRGFLRAANRSWRKREKAKLRAQKQRHAKESADLRRQLSQRQPLVNVVHRVAGGYSVATAGEPAIAESDDDELEPDHMLTEGARRAAFLEGAVWFGYRTVRSSSHAFHPLMQCQPLLNRWVLGRSKRQTRWDQRSTH